ncbi:panthothenate synthetase [Pseudomonas sp. LB3P14]
MKMLLMVECPNEPFNSLVKAGTVGEVIERILASIKPEAAYFTEQDGMRGGIFLVDVQDSSEIPALAEPFFLNFNANCKFRIVLSPQDLQKADLGTLGQTWA